MEQNTRMEKNEKKNKSGAGKGRQRMEPKAEKMESRQSNVT